MSKTEESKKAIMEAAESLLKQRGMPATSIDQVAKAAGCAKGLVHYHFGTKPKLLSEVLLQIAEARERRWLEVLNDASPQMAIDRTWKLISEEAEDGTLATLLSPVVLQNKFVDPRVRTITQEFSRTLAGGVDALLSRAGVELQVSSEEVSGMIAAVICGMGLQILSGGDPATLEDAYAAAWLAALSLAT